MADPRTMPHDLVSRRWETVPDLAHCSRCLGALPPDVDGACEVCGSGTPAAPPVTIRMVQGTFTPTGPLDPPPGYSVIDEERTFTREELAVAAAIAPPRLTWWQRFARWPNG